MATSDTVVSESIADFRLRSVFGETFAILARNLIPLAVISLPMTALYEFGVRAIAAALGVAPELVTSFDTERAFKLAFPPRGGFGARVARGRL